MITWADFEKIDMRIGIITHVEQFPQARKPAYKLTIDFGIEMGIKKSSAQITTLYDADKLVGTQVVCVVNFPPKQIGPFISECLVMGAYNAQGDIVLLKPERGTQLGS
ncbi:MAG: tRNA-binding protein, partial [Cyclobacteriaceae bacterium]